MSAPRLTMLRPPARGAARQRGLSLIELMVAILIALFLIGGIIVVEQGVNLSYRQQNGLSQLQDEERFAMSVMASVIGTAGYYPNPTVNNLVTALPAAGNFGTAGQAIYAPNSAGGAPHDSIYVRYMTAAGDGINLCDGTAAGNSVYTSYLYVAADPKGGNDLYCQLQVGNAAAPAGIALINGLTDMVISYGVATGTDNNVTEYLNAQQVTAGGLWPNVTSVQVTLTFTNPLATQNGQAVAGQPATVSFSRVISIMGRVGAS
jgi:type IV pilus assembly protein PilW